MRTVPILRAPKAMAALTHTIMMPSSLLPGHRERASVFPARPDGEDEDGPEGPGAV